MKLLKRITLTLCILSLLLVALVACDASESLRLSADKTTAKLGETVVLSTTHVTKKGEAPTTDVTYEITEGADIATLEGNKLTVSLDAEDGDKISVVSKNDTLTSNTVTITVDIPENALSILAEKNTAKRGEVVTINVALTEDGKAIDSAQATLSIISGEEYATLVGSKLTIADDAAHGSVIELRATYKTLVSNTVSVTVNVPLTGITASANASFIKPGQSVILQKTVSPAGAAGTIEWEITEGATLCAIAGDVLVVNTTAQYGSTIKVKAKSGSITSNELIFTVGEETETFLILLSQSTLTVDRNGSTASILTAEIMNSRLEEVTDKNVIFEVISGTELLSLSQSGYSCTFTALGHGDAVVRVSIEGTNTSKTASIKVVVPPSGIKLPEMFAQRLGFAYNISMIDPGTNLADRLPFAVTVLGENVCTKLKYTFTHEDGTTGDAVGTFADDKLTFYKEGRVTVTVSSDSGSKNETSVSYTFMVNKGYNVSTYDELRTLLQSGGYNGEIVNIVVTEKPVGANGYTYGYDLVPTAALKPVAEQTWQDVLKDSQITVQNKNLHLNGNRHKIDGSQLRVISKQDIDTLNNAQNAGAPNNISALLMVEPSAADAAQIAGRQHLVRIYDLEVVGNTPVDFAGDLNGVKTVGSYVAGIHIGSVDYDVVYHLEMKNITASRCAVGLRMRQVVSDSTVDNLNVYNCFSNGIEVEASIITFGKLTFGKCGAAGMELVPTNSTAAGDKLDQKQKITFAGVISTEDNLNNGQTKYFNAYMVQNYTIPQVIGAVVQGYSSEQLSHMMNAQGEFGFVTFLFNDFALMAPNNSEVVYPAYQQGGIINIKNVQGIDTTHQYIELDIEFGGLQLGKALLYNHNYQGN